MKPPPSNSSYYIVYGKKAACFLEADSILNLPSQRGWSMVDTYFTLTWFCLSACMLQTMNLCAGQSINKQLENLCCASVRSGSETTTVNSVARGLHDQHALLGPWRCVDELSLKCRCYTFLKNKSRCPQTYITQVAGNCFERHPRRPLIAIPPGFSCPHLLAEFSRAAWTIHGKAVRFELPEDERAVRRAPTRGTCESQASSYKRRLLKPQAQRK